jgi:hypothetical protein
VTVVRPRRAPSPPRLDRVPIPIPSRRRPRPHSSPISSERNVGGARAGENEVHGRSGMTRREKLWRAQACARWHVVAQMLRIVGPRTQRAHPLPELAID